VSTFSGGIGREEEDGAGWGGLVPSAAERREEAKQEALRSDAARFRYFVEDPETGRHLLLLLSQGKGDATALRNMIDRIITSKRNAQARATAGCADGGILNGTNRTTSGAIGQP
jgi:hypothetical protein